MSKYAKERFKSYVKINIELPHICKICGTKIKSKSGIATHVINKHDLTYKEYIKNILKIDIDKLNDEWIKNSYLRKEKQLLGLKKRAKEMKGVPIKKRMTKEEYNNFRNSMKGVFSKDWYIKKYGEKEGLKKYKERSKNLSKNTFWRKYNKKNKENWSKISQELFWEIYKRISHLYKNIYFGELNHEYSCGIPYCNFDFVIKDNKKVIEFNGDKFHANPKIYESNTVPLKFIDLTAKEIWKRDESKIKNLKDRNYDVKVVWESDYLKNKEKVILDCIDFLLK